MDDTLTIIVGLAVPIGLLVGVAYFLQYRSNTKGNLFTSKPSPLGRAAAAVIGLGFVGYVGYEIVATPAFHPVLGLIGLACLLYAIGFDSLMRVFQGNSKPDDGDKTK